MLKFLKKTGHKANGQCKTSESSDLQLNASSSSADFVNRNSVPNNNPLKLSGPLSNFDDEGLCDIGDGEATKERSQLSKTLSEVLSDKSAVGYLLQYLELRNASQYIRCWLDIEDFRLTVLQFNVNDKTSEETRCSTDHDSLSVSTDCDSYTADSNSLSEYLNSEDKSDRTKSDINSICDKDSDSSPKKNRQSIVDFALAIFKKYIALEATQNVHISEETRKEIIENICSGEKTLSANCFDKVQNHVFSVMEQNYFQSFLNSDCYCKHQIDVLTSGNVVLDDILYNETALFYFMEFLEQENNRSLLEFWLAATNLQQQLHDQKEFFDPIEAQSDAVVLYDKYFSLQALCPLGFSDKVRFAVEQSICGENGLILDCFHLPLKIVERVLERNYLKPFLASQLFYKYLSELISTVQTCGYNSNSFNRDKNSPSDCSSEKSFSTSSTFLAMENPNKKNKKEANMSIDTRQLYDPDSLWKRRKNNRLSFGRVSELGRYETDFEPEPDKKSQFGLKSVVRKLVSSEEEERRKEEMAWQVAEMIVKDITSVTLNPDPIHT